MQTQDGKWFGYERPGSYDSSVRSENLVEMDHSFLRAMGKVVDYKYALGFDSQNISDF